eukprot:CAMPEP_0185571926 /NCGR_PEP_ID=MMETSP0434-20130131/3921_1 /TAXON_ID=626734 ORGANISM="Favella taraikaensis, Strain Fe Narragansett Bay" /NCGR_SAMPLE_ID=MMETSP0434 /ASSEMBLY_ACC=CAM_ASM_000379 /LENGTH=81 /DNA_ID=CAMNT_0028187571 /DNA_START=329 /DNA_END=574 /DNA_ORIENTATION=-
MAFGAIMGDMMGSRSGLPPLRAIQAMQKLMKPDESSSSSQNIKLDGKNVFRLSVSTGYKGTSPHGGLMPLSKHSTVTLIVR